MPKENETDNIVLNEIKHLRIDFSKMDKRLEGMETAIKLVAVQTNQIDTLQRDLSILWKSNDDCGKDIVEIKKFQASCPREITKKEFEIVRTNMRESIRNQWIAIGILAAAFTATGVWKAL